MATADLKRIIKAGDIMNKYRKYGDPPFNVTIVHGGPGAPGEVAPVARELSSDHGILEPFQTASTIEGQINELYEIIEAAGDPPVILIGWSWGAWLSLLFTVRYPALVKKLILVGSAPFDKRYAQTIMTTRLKRMDKNEKDKTLAVIKALGKKDTANRDRFLFRLGSLTAEADSYDLLPHPNEVLEYRSDIYEKIWSEAEKLRDSGRLLELAGKITCPVVAVHGDYDPHPYQRVKEPLSTIITNFKFILIEKCGHYPWLEKEAKDKFFETLLYELDD